MYEIHDQSYYLPFFQREQGENEEASYREEEKKLIA